MRYDFIIIGNGSAGCALVNELHRRNPEKSILILEAGIDNKDDRIRNFKRVRETYTDFVWPISSVPQEQFNNRQMPYISGKVNGGTGSINGMVCAKPHAKDDVMSYLDSESIEKYLQHFQPTDMFSKDELSECIMQSFLQKGFVFSENYLNDKALSGKIAYPRLNVSPSGERLDPYSVFVRNLVLSSDKITHLNHACVDKIIIDKANAAQGVVVKIEDKELEFFATHEVILCAGAIFTPEILFKSGIGPMRMLLDNNIHMVKDLPVGENLHDQLLIYASCPVKPSFRDKHIPHVMTLTSFFNEDDFIFEPEFRFVPSDNSRQPKFQLQTYFITQSEKIEADSLAVCVVLLHPESRGKVSLQNNQLKVDPQCCSRSEDWTSLLAALKIATKITDHLPDSYYEKRVLPAPDCQSDADLIEYIKNRATTNHHPGGTCKMGTVTDKNNRVIGIKKLRVADSSIISRPVSGNPQLTAFAVGFHAAKLISADYQPGRKRSMYPFVKRALMKIGSPYFRR
ncbi:Oxygen-dependent choline dehydrogenase [Legionella birminghamensis]|uniref:Choline dehydrogenase n=1 Tax=Legionella birminghamensis TaxID=28083 RepID=A0A378IC36_9GAMM|nr:GMC family oxidoreductase [Legionella birminghamensis]KTC75513.1 Oxygen-dependent choline dehydrogenase [Legionella birminghamensis]STX32739.1 Choline dehydrogenase [Legionella birminghamensis]